MLVIMARMCYTSFMLVSDMTVERLRDAAYALDSSPVDYVSADVPAYRDGIILHPLVQEQKVIGTPFTFHPFKLSVQGFDERTLAFRLVPPSDMIVSTPIVTSENSDFCSHLPRLGYTALRGQVIDNQDGGNLFVLLGEDRNGQVSSELTMPTEESVIRLLMKVAGLVHSKAVTASVIAKK